MPRGSSPTVTTEQEQEIADAYAAGQSARNIAEAMATTERVVLSALKRRGIPRRCAADYGWKDTAENREKIVALFHDGLGVQRIAKAVGTRNGTVMAVLRDAGITPRFGGSHHRFTEADARQLAQENAEGATLGELARRYDGSNTAVRNAIRRLGVTPIIRPVRRGAANHNWKGGRTIDSDGYVHLTVLDEDRHLVGPMNGYVLEHRLVMARALGRPLTKKETVHHINGVRDDNRLENLQLRQGAHGRGVRMTCLDCGSHNVAANQLT